MKQKMSRVGFALATAAGLAGLGCASSPGLPPTSAAVSGPSHPSGPAVSLEDVVSTSPPVFGSGAPAPEPPPSDGASLDSLLRAV